MTAGLLILAGGIVLFAATPFPFASINADNGTLTSGATVNTNCTGASDGSCVVFGGSSATPTDCFASPGKCGYPDPAAPYQNVGVPPGTNLTAYSGPTDITTAGTVISGQNITGSAGPDSGVIEISANNVTIQDSLITQTSTSCGSVNACGNSDIHIDSGVTGTLIKNVELTSATGMALSEGIRNLSDTSNTAEAVYSHGSAGPDMGWFGPGTIKDSYLLATLAISSDHIENVYMQDSTIVLNHDTLLNPIGQTATLFSTHDNGLDNSGPCSNDVTITNSLLAGGGYTIYTCSHTGSVGASTMNISNNRFARCGGGNEVLSGGDWVCPNGADSYGYWPRGGAYGVADIPYCGANSSQIWSNNVWDDDNTAVGC